MNFKRLICTAALGVAAFFVTSSFDSKSADAQSGLAIPRTYKVQVEYWFFDTDYYYWSTKLETNNQAEAQFLYDILLWAKQNNQLNEVAPNSYWRYFAVDVRMVVEYDWDWLRPEYFELSPRQFRMLE